MATVEVRSLTKRFDGTVQAVDGVDFATEDGEFLVLLGPSGCGKTTLLRMIAGLEQPTSGDVLIGGGDASGLPPRAPAAALGLPSHTLYPPHTVFRKLRLPLDGAGTRKGKQRP